MLVSNGNCVKWTIIANSNDSLFECQRNNILEFMALVRQRFPFPFMVSVCVILFYGRHNRNKIVFRIVFFLSLSMQYTNSNTNTNNKHIMVTLKKKTRHMNIVYKIRCAVIWYDVVREVCHFQSGEAHDVTFDLISCTQPKQSGLNFSGHDLSVNFTMAAHNRTPSKTRSTQCNAWFHENCQFFHIV